jgi:hypothetical protein
MSESRLSQREIFQLLRDQIEHEDSVIDHRTNWLLVLQGFLVVAYVTGLANASLTLSQRTTLVAVLCVSGITLSFFALLSLGAANLHLAALVRLWEHPKDDESGEIKGLRADFPPVIGKGKWVIVNGGFGSMGTAALLMAVWISLFIYAR